MATLRAYRPLDLLDFDRRVGSVTQIDDSLIFMEYERSHWYLDGDYKYSGGDWKGDIEEIRVFDLAGDLHYEATGLELNMTYVSVGLTNAFVSRAAYKGDDRFLGSGGSDRLAGFSGDDYIRGNDGRDVIYGNDGDDVLHGGGGNDVLRGGVGNDKLSGGAGGDVLRGGYGADVFIFSRKDGRDIVSDFSGRDLIAIEGGAERFKDLRVTTVGENTKVAYARTEILLRDFDASSLGAGDFLFG